MKELDIKQDKAKVSELITKLKSTVQQTSNNWDSKKRETYIFNSLLDLNFVEDGTFILGDKELKSLLKKTYNSTTIENFNTSTLFEKYPDLDLDKIYLIHEPFGSKASPDFLFITPVMIFGIEDKSSKNEKVSFNTGTPGGNKFIMYLDKKSNKVHLISGKQWNWDEKMETEFREFTQHIRAFAKNEFARRFGDRIKNMEYYARPMLVDKNKIKDLVDKDEQDVVDILMRVL